MKQKLFINIGIANIVFCLICGNAFAQTAQSPNNDSNNSAISSGAMSRSRAQSPLSNAQLIEALRAPIMAIPSVRGIVIDENDGAKISVYASRKLDLRLENFASQMNAPRANRPRELQKYLAMIREAITGHDPFKPEALRIIVRTTAAVDEFENETALNGVKNHVVRRVLVGNLEEVIVADSSTSIAFMPIGRLKDLNLEGPNAFEIARQNTSELAKTAIWSDDNGVLTARLDGAYEASLLGVDALWPAMEAQLGGPLAIIVPNRGKLIVARADKPQDMSRLQLIANQASDDPHQISNKIYLRQENHWIEQN